MTSPRPPIRFAFALTLALAACDTPAETPPETNACDNDPTACGMVSGATCTPAGDSFTCDCPAGYASPGVGARCDELDECDAGPELACGLATATCSNTVGSYRCTCPAGYANAGLGTPCAPLDPGACDPGYAPTGQNGACQDINECQPGAEATCGLPNASCSNKPGTFSCWCPAGFAASGDGTPCAPAANTCDPGYAPTGVNGACQDINECQAGLATTCGVAGASCSNKPGTFECTACPAGWSKQGPGLPCIDVDECATADIVTRCGVAGATCENKVGTFHCTCPAGYALQTIAGNPEQDGVKCFDVDECQDADFCEAICKNTVGAADCVSTIADIDSPYWQYACPAPDDRFIDNPTHFDMDCRCSFTQVGRPDDPSHPDYAAFYRCNLVSDEGTYALGTGPSVRQWRRELGADSGATYLNGGFLDHAERKLYVGTQWKDNTATDGDPEFTYYGAILAVDVNWDSPTVGNRTLISGYTLDGQRGDGPTLRAVKDIKRGPDGKLYTMSWESGHPAQIMRIDPATGDRTLVWKEAAIYHGAALPPSQCHNGSTVGVDSITNGARYSLQMVLTGQNLTMAPNGDFFLGASQNGPAKGPRGIVRISADGSTCTWVTRFAATNGNRYAPKAPADQGADYGLASGTGPLGAGPNNFASNPVNLHYREDAAGVAWLYALDGIGSGGTGTRYYRVNIATGDRENLFSSILGDSHNVWDPHREVLWTSGGFDTTRIVAVDLIGHDGAPPTELGGLRCLSTTSDWYKCMRGPGDGNNQNRGGTFYDPLDHNLVIAHGSWGLVRVEIATGNTYVFSR